MNMIRNGHARWLPKGDIAGHRPRSLDVPATNAHKCLIHVPRGGIRAYLPRHLSVHFRAVPLGHREMVV
jgi:hypothetical protein